MTWGSDDRVLKQLKRKAIDKFCADMPKFLGLGSVDGAIAMAEYLATRFENSNVEEVLAFWESFYPSTKKHDTKTLGAYAFWLSAWESDMYPNVILRRKRIAEFATYNPTDAELKAVRSPWSAFRLSLIDSPLMLWSERDSTFEPMQCVEVETSPKSQLFLARVFSKTTGAMFVDNWEEPGENPEGPLLALRGILWNAIERLSDESLRTDLRSRALSKTFKQSGAGKRFGHRKLQNFVFTEDVQSEPDMAAVARFNMRHDGVSFVNESEMKGV